MVAFDALLAEWDANSTTAAVYEATQPLNIYDSPALEKLATQIWTGRQLRFQPIERELVQQDRGLPIVLVEDNYPGWFAPTDVSHLKRATTIFAPPDPSLAEIQQRLPQVIAFAEAAMKQPNFYLWGGTVGPNYDCSGLMQHAFASHGIWLPRDAYQQEAFLEPLVNPGDRPEDLMTVLEPGDLVFFGTPVKATHVALYLGEGRYIHSSGKDQGRDGIGVDVISDQAEQVSRNYYAQFRGGGRTIRSYKP